MSKNPIKLVKDLVGYMWEGSVLGARIWESIITGDPEELAGELLEALELAIEMQEPVIEVAKLQALLAVGIVYGQVAAAIASGSIQVPLAVQAMTLAQKVNGDYERMRTYVDRVQNPVMGIIDSARVQAAVTAARRAHRIGMIVSPAYREQVEGVMDSTRELSRSVFGDANTVNSALNLVQMATYDATRLSGEPVDLAESRYFHSVQTVGNLVEVNSRSYSRNPGKFWLQVNEFIVQPLQEDATRAQTDRDRRINTLAATLDLTEEVAEGARDRLRDYTDEMEPFLSDEKLRELDRIRRDWQLSVVEPIHELNEFVEVEFPKSKRSITQNRSRSLRNQLNVNANKRIIADPEDLTESYREAQRLRVTSWLDNLDPEHSEPPLTVEETHQGIVDIFERLEEE